MFKDRGENFLWILSGHQTPLPDKAAETLEKIAKIFSRPDRGPDHTVDDSVYIVSTKKMAEFLAEPCVSQLRTGVKISFIIIKVGGWG